MTVSLLIKGFGNSVWTALSEQYVFHLGHREKKNDLFFFQEIEFCRIAAFFRLAFQLLTSLENAWDEGCNGKAFITGLTTDQKHLAGKCRICHHLLFSTVTKKSSWSDICKKIIIIKMWKPQSKSRSQMESRYVGLSKKVNSFWVLSNHYNTSRAPQPEPFGPKFKPTLSPETFSNKN